MTASVQNRPTSGAWRPGDLSDLPEQEYSASDPAASVGQLAPQSPASVCPGSGQFRSGWLPRAHTPGSRAPHYARAFSATRAADSPSRENAAAATGGQAGGGRTSGARSGDGACHPASRRPAARRSPAGDDRPATETSAGPDRKRAPGTQPDDGANRKGTGTETC